MLQDLLGMSDHETVFTVNHTLSFLLSMPGNVE